MTSLSPSRNLPIPLAACALILLSLTTPLVSSQIVVIGTGACPQTGTKADFDVTKYVGRWYELQRFGNWFERNLRCVYAQYDQNADGSVRVENGGIDTRTDEPATVSAKATVPDPDKPAELKVTFSPLDFTRRANYIVVDTDYTGYAVVFSCFKLPVIPINVQFAWILTRTRGAAPSNLEAIKSSLQEAGVNTSKFIDIDQTNCSNA